MAEKPWYTAMKDINPEQNSLGIADWYKQANTPLNPVSIKDIPKEYQFIYTFIYKNMIDTFENEDFKTTLNTFVKQLIKSLVAKNLDKLKFYRQLQFMTYDKIYNLVRKEYTAIEPMSFNFSLFVNSLDEFNKPYSCFKLLSTNMAPFNNYFNINELITGILNDAPPYSSKQDSLYKGYQIALLKILEHLSTRVNTLNTDVKDQALNQDQKKKLIYKYFIELAKIITGFPIINKTQTLDTPAPYWKIIYENLEKFPSCYSFKDTKERELILTPAFITSFKSQIELLHTDGDKKEYMKIFFHNLEAMLSVVDNTEMMYDRLDILKNNDGKYLMKSYEFRDDFDKSKADEYGFTDDEIKQIFECLRAKNVGFSHFIFLLKDKSSKQEIVDSLTQNSVSRCSFPTSFTELQPSQVKQAEFKQLNQINTTVKVKSLTNYKEDPRGLTESELPSFDVNTEYLKFQSMVKDKNSKEYPEFIKEYIIDDSVLDTIEDLFNENTAAGSVFSTRDLNAFKARYETEDHVKYYYHPLANKPLNDGSTTVVWTTYAIVPKVGYEFTHKNPEGYEVYRKPRIYTTIHNWEETTDTTQKQFILQRKDGALVDQAGEIEGIDGGSAKPTPPRLAPPLPAEQPLNVSAFGPQETRTIKTLGLDDDEEIPHDTKEPPRILTYDPTRFIYEVYEKGKTILFPISRVDDLKQAYESFNKRNYVPVLLSKIYTDLPQDGNLRTKIYQFVANENAEVVVRGPPYSANDRSGRYNQFADYISNKSLPVTLKGIVWGVSSYGETSPDWLLSAQRPATKDRIETFPQFIKLGDGANISSTLRDTYTTYVKLKYPISEGLSWNFSLDEKGLVKITATPLSPKGGGGSRAKTRRFRVSTTRRRKRSSS